MPRDLSFERPMGFAAELRRAEARAAAVPRTRARRAARRGEAGGEALPRGAGGRAWDRVAALAGHPRVVVSVQPPDAWMERLRAPRAAPARPEAGAPAALHARPAGSAYHAPGNPAEELLAGLMGGAAT